VQDVSNAVSILARMRGEFSEFDTAMSHTDERELESVVGEIDAAIVLLRCAENKLTATIPTEEYMPKDSVREFWK